MRCNSALSGAITGDPEVRMQWKHYWRNVVRRHHVLIEGWPTKVPFKNLSETSSSITDLEDLLRSLRSGNIHWRELSDEEFERVDAEREVELEKGNIQEPTPRHRRSDRGKKRSKCQSRPIIESSGDEEEN